MRRCVFGIVAGRDERLAVAEPRAVDPFGDEHVAAGQLPVDRRQPEIRLRSVMFSAISE